MDNVDTLAKIERDLWLGGADSYRAHLDELALMVLPDPAGTMGREDAIAAIASAPRWEQVHFEGLRLLSPTPDLAFLVYEATAHRKGNDAPYRARATSAYVFRDGAWMLVLHQQTPLDS